MSDARTVKPGEAVTYAEVEVARPDLRRFLATMAELLDVCRCGSPLLPSARARGDGLCGPCSRGASFRTIAGADRVNHDPGDEDR